MLLVEVTDVHPKRLLLIEDDQTIAELLAYNLRNAGYDVLLAADGRTGLDLALSEDLDLVLVDLMLPRVDGMTVARDLSRARPGLPLIVVTARADRDTKLEGFESGADDYVTKPFDLDELLARIAALLRRSASSAGRAEDPVRVDGIRLSADAHVLQGPLGEVFLNPKEYDLLDLLLSRPGHLFSREEIMRRVWQQDFSPTTRTLDVHVRYVRAKLEQVDAPVTIQNIRGVGYRIAPLAGR